MKVSIPEKAAEDGVVLRTYNVTQPPFPNQIQKE